MRRSPPENEWTLEPLPMVRRRTVVMRAVGLTKIYPAVSDEGSGRSGEWAGWSCFAG